MTQRVAVVFDTPGSPDVFRVAAVPRADPGQHEALVRVTAAGVHPADLAARHGLIPLRGAGPHVIGMAISGAVEAVGKDSSWRIGDRVFGMTLPSGPHGGGYQSHVVAPDDTLARVPEHIDLAAAAALPMNGHTAVQALRAIEQSDGDPRTIGIVGAAGALGSVLVALATNRGHRVVAVARAQDRETVTDLGSHVFVEAGDGIANRMIRAAAGKLDAVIDLAVLDDELLPAVRPEGTLVTLRGWQGNAEATAHSVRIIPLAVPAEWRHGSQLEEVLQGPHLQRRVRHFAPHETAQAHRAVEARGLRENVVIVFDSAA